MGKENQKKNDSLLQYSVNAEKILSDFLDKSSKLQASKNLEDRSFMGILAIAFAQIVWAMLILVMLSAYINEDDEARGLITFGVCFVGVAFIVTTIILSLNSEKLHIGKYIALDITLIVLISIVFFIVDSLGPMLITMLLAGLLSLFCHIYYMYRLKDKVRVLKMEIQRLCK